VRRKHIQSHRVRTLGRGTHHIFLLVMDRRESDAQTGGGVCLLAGKMLNIGRNQRKKGAKTKSVERGSCGGKANWTLHAGCLGGKRGMGGGENAYRG